MHLSKQWLFTKNVCPENLQAIPEGCKSFEMDSCHSIDIDTITGCKGAVGDECIVYNRFELESDMELAFGMGADWWFEAYLNGELLLSTFASGNQSRFYSINNHWVLGQGRKGENILAVQVRRGGGSWQFCLGEKNVNSVEPCSPMVVTVDKTDIIGDIKPMNAVNNGPIRVRKDQSRGNMDLWKAAKIPFARNHDAAFYSSYGGEHSVDVHAIFPDFSKDPNDPDSYDFTLTDIYSETILEGGTQIFYRLGSKIEHAPKKYGTKVPPDFQKWAVICEHIIRHLTEGWADGHHWDIRYWEIWNEPDLSSGASDKKTWQGTDEQFFEFYRTAALHLKSCFPHLKIGGPAICGNFNWAKRFLAALTEGKRVPLDFFSWHCYTTNPTEVKELSFEVRRMLDDFGYQDSESILNEWNYVRGWTKDWVYSIKTMIGLKGAVFTAAAMSAAQRAPVDMLMYYDARPCAMNGLFDFYTFAPLKGYFTFCAWAKLAELGHELAVDTQDKVGIYATAATDGKDKIGVLVSRYFESDLLPGELPVSLLVNGMSLWGAKLYCLDEKSDLTSIPYETGEDGSIKFAMKANTLIYLEK